MAKKRKPKFSEESYGRYTHWEKGSRELPKILEFTNKIIAEEGNEFGIILNVENGKGALVDFCIKHPPIKDEKGKLMPDFTGQLHIPANTYQIFVGDSVWAPIDDKIGEWRVIISFEGKTIADRKFVVR